MCRIIEASVHCFVFKLYLFLFMCCFILLSLTKSAMINVTTYWTCRKTSLGLIVSKPVTVIINSAFEKQSKLRGLLN